MKIESLQLGLKVRHPQYGIGVVRAINPQTAEVVFTDLPRMVSPELSGLELAEPQVAVTGLEVPLAQFVRQVAQDVAAELIQEHDHAVVEQLGVKWHKGKMVMHPADPTLQTKEVPMEIFFHKVVGLRNQLRVLEQKINGHPGLTDGEKVEMQQYITRCYGSLTTFNLLFKNKEDQFSSKGESV
ncbi:MAG: hypothetical protein WCO56_22465 [Verrucomicrobiota bacterium]